MESTMVKTKKITKYLLLLCFIVFPLGKLFQIHILDILVFLISALYLTKALFKFRNLPIFVWILILSFVASFLKFDISEIFVGFLYSLRLLAYLTLPLAISQTEISQNSLQKFLIFSSLAAAILGLLQYFALPDLRFLKIWGWDDHYFRLTFPFLDPAFTGIIFVLTILFLLGNQKIVSQNKTKIFSIIVLAALGLTFSRSSFAALFFAFVYLFFKKQLKLKQIIYILGFLIFVVIIAPKPGGEGVNLTRTNSLAQKAYNYKQSFEIISQSPVLGVGFNNVCLVRNDLKLSHSCHGLDNSFLFIWATTGVVGFVAFIYLIYQIFTHSNYAFQAIVIAVVLHSFFTNTLFYNFVMFWLAIAWTSSKVDKLRLD